MGEVNSKEPFRRDGNSPLENLDWFSNPAQTSWVFHPAINGEAFFLTG